MASHTKNIGNIGEAVAIAEFSKLNIPVLLPFGDNLPYDMVIELNGVFKRIQVKTTELIKDDKMIFRTNVTDPFNLTNRKYSNTEVDYFFLYCIENGYVGLLPYSEYTGRDTHIRLTVPKNNQTKGIKMYYDYTLEKVLHTGM